MGRFVNLITCLSGSTEFRIYVDKTGLIACMNNILDLTDAYICKQPSTSV